MSRSDLPLRDGRVLPADCFHVSFARGGGPGEALVATGLAIAAMVGLAVILRLLLRPLMLGVAMARSTELFLAACLLLVLGAGLAASPTTEAPSASPASRSWRPLAGPPCTARRCSARPSCPRPRTG